jgi:hypothetical protein
MQNLQLVDNYRQNAQTLILKEVLPIIKQMVLDNIENQSSMKSIVQNPEAQQTIENMLKNVIKLNEDNITNLINKMPESDKFQVEKLLVPKLNLNVEERFNNLQSVIGSDDINRIKSEIKSIFEKHFVKNTSENLAEDLRVNDSYKDLLLKLDVVKDAVSTQRSSDGLVNLITQTQDNIKFMNYLSQYNTFVQIPLNIWGQNTNGELFVLKKSQKKIDPNNASVFLSLDMPNMGLTEVLVTVSGRNVMCNFRLENEKIAGLVRKNASKLTEAISKLGYNAVDVGCGLIQKKTNLLEINKVASEAAFIGRNSIDTRV